MAFRPLQTATLPSLRTCALKVREQGDTLRNGRWRTSWRRGRRSGGPSTLQLPPRLKGSSHLQCRHAAEGDWSASSRRSNSVRRYPWPRIQVRVGDCRKSDGRIVCEYCVYSLEKRYVRAGENHSRDAGLRLRGAKAVQRPLSRRYEHVLLVRLVAKNSDKAHRWSSKGLALNVKLKGTPCGRQLTHP